MTIPKPNESRNPTPTPQAPTASALGPRSSALAPAIHHHGGATGVTGSCHRLQITEDQAILVDCGLFQGKDHGPQDTLDRHKIDFPIDDVVALVVTHVHIDHVGRIPYLLAAGYQGPIYCSHPSARLLPLVLEDALKIGFTRNNHLIERFLEEIEQRTQPIDYNNWHNIIDDDQNRVRLRLQRAGHILGSAYAEFDITNKHNNQNHRIVFSGDLGAPSAPLLPAPEPPERADVLILESTYGNRTHEDREHRTNHLKTTIEHALTNKGTIIIPAFAIGRTQELLYELETIIHEQTKQVEVTSRPRTNQAGPETKQVGATSRSRTNEAGLETNDTGRTSTKDVGRLSTQQPKPRTDPETKATARTSTKDVGRVSTRQPKPGTDPETKDAGRISTQQPKPDTNPETKTRDRTSTKDVGRVSTRQPKPGTDSETKDVGRISTQQPKPDTNPETNARDRTSTKDVGRVSTQQPKPGTDPETKDVGATSVASWQNLEIIVDSPLASNFTKAYRDLKPYWDKEAQQRIKTNRHPLNFENLYTIDTHNQHQQTVDYLAKTRRPAVVITASGMCTAGRVLNYLEKMLEDEHHTVLFIGYQAEGTPGHAIQQAGQGGTIELNGKQIRIRARIETISGYSAHADQNDLLDFVTNMTEWPREIRLVHGDQNAQQNLKHALECRARESEKSVVVTLGGSTPHSQSINQGGIPKSPKATRESQ